MRFPIDKIFVGNSLV